MPGYLKLAAAAAVAAVAEAGNVYVGRSDLLSSSTDFRPVMSETDVSFLLARLVGTDSPLETKPPNGLPAAHMFHKSDSTIALVVTGAEEVDLPENYAAYEYPLHREAPTAGAAINGMLTGHTDQRPLIPDICASADPTVESACLESGSVFTYNPTSKSFDGLVAHDKATEFFSKVGLEVTEEGVATHIVTGTQFDMNEEQNLMFMSEMAALYSIPDSLETQPKFSLLSMVGPDLVKSRATDANVTLAVDMIVAAAIPTILDAWNSRYPEDHEVFEVVVLRQNGAKRARWNRELDLQSAPRRALQTATGYTSEDTANYQIFTWTWFLLLLIVFFSACSLGGLDIGNDDAGLYSTFKAGSYDRVTHEHEN